MSRPHLRDYVSTQAVRAANEVMKPVPEQHLDPIAGELFVQCSSCGDVCTVVVFRDGQFHHGRLIRKEGGWLHRPCSKPIRLYGNLSAPKQSPQGLGPSDKAQSALQHRWCCRLKVDSTENPEALPPGMERQVRTLSARRA